MNSFSGGVINPYISIYAVQLGATTSEMGWLRSLNNLFSNIMQVFWGMACDRIGRYVPFIVLGGILSSLLWLPMLYVTTPWQLIIIIAFQALANSMVAPSWASLLGRILPKNARGSGTASANAAASLGTISATLFSGFLMEYFGGTPAQMYRLPIIIAAISGFIASLTILTIHEEKSRSHDSKQKWFDWQTLRNNKSFQQFVFLNVSLQFFMSMAWPLFPITIVMVTKSDIIQIAFISIISPTVAFMIRRYSGRLSDRAGRKPLIVLGRTGTFLYPLFYAFATTSTHLYVAEFLIGVVGSISEIAVFAYMLDITSEEQRGASIAVHNTLIGFATFLGSILGGYFVGFFTLLGMDPATSIVASYFVSSGGRLVSGLLFLRLKETYVYPSTIRRELVDIVTEDMEKTQNRIKKIDEIGEKAELEFVRDMENFETTPERHRKSEDAKQIDEERQKKNPKKDTQKS